VSPPGGSLKSDVSNRRESCQPPGSGTGSGHYRYEIDANPDVRDGRGARERGQRGADSPQMAWPDRCEGVARSPGAAEAHLDANQALIGIQGDEINLAFR
jgi:hypothetical protein